MPTTIPSTTSILMGAATPFYYQAVGTSVISTLNSPSFQGIMQAGFGIAEAAVGGALTIYSGGTAACAGWALVAHGLDQTATGLQTAFTGQHKFTVSEMLLQKTGMPTNTASLVNDGISTLATMGGGAMLQGGRSALMLGSANKYQINEAFNVANNGGRNAGFLKNNLSRNIEELKKGIASLEKQIALHKDKILNPTKHIENWHTLDSRQQQALINKKWPSDIQRQIEQRDILRHILNEKL